jgi:UDP-glucose 4-epimerase
MSSIAIMGGAGYIGSHVVKYLLKQGLSPVVYDNLSTGHASAVRECPLVEGDIGDAERLDAFFRRYQPEAVMNFAGLIAVGESVCEPERYYQTNVFKTLTLLARLRAAGIEHFIFSSSCAIYGPPQFLPLTEAHPFAPVSPYGNTKLAIELALADYSRAYTDFRYVSLRYFNAAGADPEGELGETHEPETHLIPLVLATLTGQYPAIQIHGTDYPTPDGTCIRDYIHVWDLAQAHLRALHHLQQGGRSVCLNLGNGNGYSVREVIATAERVTGQRVPVTEGPRRAGDPPVLVGSGASAHALLGWKPQYDSLEPILASAWAWHQRTGHGSR